ncbi:MAG: DUF4491 family protein [Anaerolineae bacterium]|nr:DUF4491 family protein [Anaerolineae bacterium]
MELNWLGPASAAATFLGVWIGSRFGAEDRKGGGTHLDSRMLALLLGIGLLTASFLTSNLIPSAICGILAVTLLWDALELAVRQPNRVKRGHAPANPHNPRHARILATYPEATTIDPLERDPRGSPYSNDEIASFKDASS